MFSDLDLTIPKFNSATCFSSFPDMIGQVTHPGDIVVLGITAGRSGSLTIAMVKKFEKHSSSSKDPIFEKLGGPPDYGATPVHSKYYESCRVVYMALMDSSNRYSRESRRHASTSPGKMLKIPFSLEDLTSSCSSFDDFWGPARVEKVSGEYLSTFHFLK